MSGGGRRRGSRALVKWSLSGLAAMALLGSLPGTAAADSVISYSAPEGSYGWCAGYGRNRAHGCARGYCVDSGGSACEAVVECRGGWGAIAFPQAPARGVGAICDMGNAFSARVWALSHCAAVANTLCWTDVTFNGRGSETLSADDAAFDRAWYVQLMLQMRHYDPGSADGAVGRRTREALSAFQADAGLPADGRLTDQTFDRLLDAVGGPVHLAKVIEEEIVVPRDEAAYGYALATTPAPELSVSDAMAALPDAERRTRAAAILNASGNPCTVPAESAERPFDEGELWSIDCAEGSFTLILSDDGSRIIMGN